MYCSCGGQTFPPVTTSVIFVLLLYLRETSISQMMRWWHSDISRYIRVLKHLYLWWLYYTISISSDHVVLLTTLQCATIPPFIYLLLLSPPHISLSSAPLPLVFILFSYLSHGFTPFIWCINHLHSINHFLFPM